MKILVVHLNFLLPDAPGGSRFNEMTRLWAERGHDVTVIAGTLDYATGTRPARFRRRWTTRERQGAVTVWRCHVPTSYGRSYVGRMWAFFAFTLSAGTAALRVPRPDIVIGSSPPLVATLPAWMAARWRRRPTPWIFEVRDLWPESAVTTGVLRAEAGLTRLLYRLERWACRAAARVVTLTPAFAADIERRGLAGPDRLHCLPNGADLGLFAPGARENGARAALGWGERFVVLYAGALGRANAARQLVEAATRLRGREDILIACVGDGPERAELERAAAERGLRNITFHGARPKAEMPDIIAACDVGAAVLQRNATFRTVYPNKIFDYMASARPVLLAIDGAARELVCERAHAGVFAEPEDAGALAAAITRLADDGGECARLGANGRAWVLAHADRRRLAEEYLELLEATARRDARRATGKRVVDAAAAAIGLVALAPVLATIAVAIRWRMGAPVLFRQARVGRGGQEFIFYKFRTMREAADAEGRPLPDAARLTALGRFLRATSLDELPQLWNVLRGDMSLVGPRPLLARYQSRYSPQQRRRHEVKPGITGWAQVHGRNTLSWEEKFAHDVWYVEHRSFGLDVRILAMTAVNVVRRQGIAAAGHASMPEFLGESTTAAKGAGR